MPAINPPTTGPTDKTVATYTVDGYTIHVEDRGQVVIEFDGRRIGAISGPAGVWCSRHDVEHYKGGNPCSFAYLSQKGTRLNVGQVESEHYERAIAATRAACKQHNGY